MEKPVDVDLLRTSDGSFTLRHERLDEHYHSVHGALQESRHVFIEAGLRVCGGKDIAILEVGLGTGLNALLTWGHARMEGVRIDYLGLEPFPLREELLNKLGHVALVGPPIQEEDFLQLMTAPADVVHRADDLFSFMRSTKTVQDLDAEDRFDLVYFDAFAPTKQPEMWTAEVFARLFRAMRPGGLLVTYCAKGEVRRTMQAAGFSVERLPGPPGKREMLRAIRPSHG